MIKIFEEFINIDDPFGEEDWDDIPSCYLIFRYRIYFKNFFLICEYNENGSFSLLNNDEYGEITEFDTYMVKENTLPKLILNERTVNKIKNGDTIISCPFKIKHKYNLEQITPHLKPDLPIVYLTKENMDEFNGRKYKGTNDTGPM